MAWPKGKPRRKPVTLVQDPVPAEEGVERRAAQRAILLHRLRGEFVPRELRMHDSLTMAGTMRRVRAAMLAAGASIDQVEAFVDEAIGG